MIRGIASFNSPTFEAMVIRLDKNEFNPPADFQLVCISSAMKEYQLAHRINVGLQFRLARETDVNDDAPDTELPVYCRYVWDDELACRTVQLLGNRPLVRQELARPGDLFGSESITMLMPELTKADYMLQLFGNFEPEEVNDICEVLHGIQGVNLAFITPVATIKDITPLLV